MMTHLADMIWIETRKATRSKVPVLAALGFMIVPLASAFLMFIYLNPDFARVSGLISAKVELATVSADWPNYLNMMAQAIGIGGILLFTIIESWVFGREFSDSTLKDLLAVPVSRSTVVLAKFIVVSVWSIGLVLMIYVVGLLVGSLIGLPGVSLSALLSGGVRLLVTGLLVVAVVTPAALVASIGRGYLLPMGVAVLVLALTNVIAVTGRGSYVPWAVPALYAGAAGSGNAALEPISYAVVILTGLAGMAGVYLWWKHADQNR